MIALMMQIFTINSVEKVEKCHCLLKFGFISNYAGIIEELKGILRWQLTPLLNYFFVKIKGSGDNNNIVDISFIV